MQFTARIKDKRTIIATAVGEGAKDKNFTFIVNGVARVVLQIAKKSVHDTTVTFELHGFPDLELGNRYAIADEHFNEANLSLAFLLEDSSFEDDFYYDGDDLGSRYSSKETTFALWSPLACAVSLKYIHLEETHIVPMIRTKKGVYRATIEGDIEKAQYHFLVNIDGVVRETIDPYAKASTQNSLASIVVDFEKLKVNMQRDKLPPFVSYCDAIIYETSVRDLTSSEGTNIIHKGRFLGMTEKDKVSESSYAVGLDYIKKIGVTHVQLLPIYDFATVDETNPNARYNWGYDPIQYNVPEGSFASILEDPYSRIRDLKKLVATYHLNGIRIVMDVVYNHMYDMKGSAFEAVMPGYYFRRGKNGSLSNGSFCGNDIASEKKMARKFIVDSCLFWINEYGIDGFRVDLMGIIDIQTMQEIEEKCLAIRPDFMIYGEGWNMPTELEEHKRSTMYNYTSLPGLGFFNDQFRDIIKGKTSNDELYKKGYLTGDSSFLELFKFVYLGSACSYGRNPSFLAPGQSINYLECHDNNTLFDKVAVCCKEENIEQQLRRVALMNVVNILAFGVPFLHMGQEIGLSKFGDHNSYKSGDRINQFDYSKIDNRKLMLKLVRDAIKLRKKHSFFRESNPYKICQMVTFHNLDNGGVMIDYVDKEAIAPFRNFKIILNPSLRTIYHSLGDYYKVIFNEAGLLPEDMFSQSLMVNGLTLVIVAN